MPTRGLLAVILLAGAGRRPHRDPCLLGRAVSGTARTSQQTGMIAKPADGPFSWIDRTDAGEAAAIILAGDHSFDGPTDLTATRPVTLEDFARIASELTGRAIERIVIDDEQWVADEVASGTPESIARFTLSMFQATRTGHFAHVSPLLSELLGREPRSAAEQLSDDIA